MSEQGLLTYVGWEYDGTEAREDIPLGETVLPVLDVGFLPDSDVVWIGEQTYRVLDADEEALTITIETPLVEDVLEGEAIVPDAGGAPARLFYGEVMLVDNAEPIRIPIPWELRATLADGEYDPGRPIILADDMETIEDLPGQQPVITPEALDPGSIPPTPPDPPTTPVFFVTGFPRGFMVQVTNPEPGVLYTYTVQEIVDETAGAEVSYPPTGRSVVYFEEQPNGLPFSADNTYRWRVKAENISGDAESSLSNPFALVLNDDSTIAELAVGKLRAGDLVGAFALLGSLQVGEITIDPVNGITIPLADGGMIRLPADGSDAVVTAILRARSLIVEDNLRIQGQVNAIEGGLVLANGISAPTIPPRVGTTWAHADAFTDTEVTQFFGNAFGLFDNGPHWLVNEAFFGGSVWLVQKATGVRFLLKTLPSGFIPTGGTVRVGSSYYVLGDDSNRAGRWFVYVYDSTWTKTGEWEFDYDGSNAKHPVLATDGTDLYIGRMNQVGGTNDSRIRIRRFTTAGVQVGTNVDVTVPDPRVNATGMWVGLADFGSPDNHAVFTTPTRVYVVNLNTGNRIQSREWARAAGDEIRGIGWDGTRFHTLGASGKVWHYSTNVTDATRSVTHTWYDNQNPEHETQASPAKVWTQPRRQWMSVETDPPAYAGGADDPNAIRVYIDNKRQPDLATMQTEVVYDVPSTSGPAAPTSNGFDSVGTAPGSLTSDASDTSGPLIRLDGDGSGRVGPLSWDAAGNAPDTGDLAASNGFTGSARAIRHGKVVYIVGSMSNPTLTGTVWTSTGIVLPEDFRPSATVDFPISTSWSSNNAFGFRLHPDGTLECRRQSTSNLIMGLAFPFFV